LGPVNQDVLNLADTLTTQAEEEPSAPPEASDRPRRPRSDADQRDRLRRVMNRLSRIHDPPSASYSDRVPRQNSLYDWSPANEADDEDELDQILAEMRSQRPGPHQDMLRMLGRSQVEGEREQRMSPSSRLLSSNQPSAAETSLRSAAILQSVRRHPRFAARTRDYLQRHHGDGRSASRSPHRSESRDPYSASDARQIAMQRLAERRAALALEREREAERELARERELELERERERDRDTLERASWRRIRGRYIGSQNSAYVDRSLSSPPVSPLLEQTIKYLSRIRYVETIGQSCDYALEAGFLTKEDLDVDSSDFLYETLSLPPPPPTSWLAPGAVLSGCQHATTVTSSITSAGPGATNTLYRFRNGDSMTSTVFDASRPWQSHTYTSPHQRTMLAATAHEAVLSQSPQQDRWPVKVTIHTVDYTTMSLSATMEAYNVPSHPHSHSQSQPQHPTLDPLSPSLSSPFTRTSSITTFLEGEILDFNTHTLFTESFKSTANNDATYWRKLPCFRDYTDTELVRNLTSRRWWEEVLTKEWVLMRWKERCFVKSLSSTSSSSSSSAAAVQPAHYHPPNAIAVDSFHPPNPSPLLEGHYHIAQAGDEHITTFEDSSCGLTISGFYYVCLRRSDGRVEGLYYDPQSSPYQCLKLESCSAGAVWPAWEFA
jgi:hypothetical protein